ncbi:MAG TPA: prepilin peptidase [Novosphingobium sp.]|nr:prepilin peptidase [Novosphingobium sp.]
MTGGILAYGLLAALAIALLIAAFTDLRARRIDNWLTVGVALGAPAFWFASGLPLWPGVALQLGFALAAFVVLAALFAIRAMGGGDVKLLTALALWLPLTPFLKLLVMMALVGGLLTILIAAWHRIRRAEGKVQIPYGVAIAGSGLWVLGTTYWPAGGQLG